jgi:hypothetical protein
MLLIWFCSCCWGQRPRARLDFLLGEPPRPAPSAPRNAHYGFAVIAHCAKRYFRSDFRSQFSGCLPPYHYMRKSSGKRIIYCARFLNALYGLRFGPYRMTATPDEDIASFKPILWTAMDVPAARWPALGSILYFQSLARPIVNIIRSNLSVLCAVPNCGVRVVQAPAVIAFANPKCEGTECQDKAARLMPEKPLRRCRRRRRRLDRVLGPYTGRIRRRGRVRGAP